MKGWQIVKANGTVLECVHKTYSSAIFARQILRSMGLKNLKIVRAS